MRELRALVDGYAVAVDERDGDGFGSLFAEDAWLAVGSSRYDGRAAIATIPAKLARFEITLHLVSTHRAVVVDADRATGVAYCEAHHRIGGEDTVQFIRYDDEYVRQPDGWRFGSRTVNMLWEERR